MVTVLDLSSLDRSHQVYDHKAKRTHHLLSNLELAIFLILEWNLLIQDMREQSLLRTTESDDEFNRWLKQIEKILYL